MKVLLLQLPVPNNRRANLPLALGYLKASADAAALPGLQVELLDPASQNLGGEALLVDAILACDPDLVGMSLYTWNSSRSLLLAKALKQRAPELLIIGGGPEINHDGDFILNSPYFDYLVQGEGEQTFVELLRQLNAGQKKITPDNFKYSVHVPLPPVRSGSSNNLNFVRSPASPALPVVLSGPALEDVNSAPSAYLTGALEGHLGRFMSIELSRWCPSKCTFCYYGRQDILRGGKRYFDLERVRKELLFGMERGIEQVHFVEANFNTLPHLGQLYDLLKDSKANRQMSFYAEMRGEAITTEQASRLAETNFSIVEVGLQSAVPEVLARVRRKNNLPRLAQGVHNLRGVGIEVFLDLILGLPGETPATFQQSVDWIDQNELAPFDLFHLQMLPGTQLKSQAHAGQHGMRWQVAPPYFVLETAELSFEQLCELRRRTLLARQDDPAEVAGLPQPGPYSLVAPARDALSLAPAGPVERVILDFSQETLPPDTSSLKDLARQVASELTVWLKLGQANFLALAAAGEALTALSAPNPAGMWHLFVESDRPLTRLEKLELAGAIRHEEGYLDRLAVFAQLEADFQDCPRWPSINFYEVLPLEAALSGPTGRDTVIKIDLKETDSLEQWQRQLTRLAAFSGAGLVLDTGTGCPAGRFKTAFKGNKFAAGNVWLTDLNLAVGLAYNQAGDLASASDSLIYPSTALVSANKVYYHNPSGEQLQQAALNYRLAATKGYQFI
jgi:radical SAM superfamily enzyme YgiQ (UPF0313 family)